MSDYVTLCATCRGLYAARRSDSLTCGSSCRSKLNRDPELKAWVAGLTVGAPGITPAMVLMARAVELLRPDLTRQIIVGSRTLEECQGEVIAEYRKLLERCNT